MQSSALEQVLDLMHAAILVADFTALSRMAAELEAGLAGLERPDQALLQRISRKAARNATCLQAATRGIGAAQRRLTELRQNASGLVTYDGTGKRAEFGGHGHLTRRF